VSGNQLETPILPELIEEICQIVPGDHPQVAALVGATPTEFAGVVIDPQTDPYLISFPSREQGMPGLLLAGFLGDGFNAL
jgi:hypothetical protein